MTFDLSGFFRYNYKAFFKAKGTNYHLTPKRFFILVVWLLLYIPAELINHFCFLLDDLFFPAYHRQKIENPIFIIGNPRSGTTFLHRLMYKDKKAFTAFTVWELAFAPSIIQRKVVWGIAKISNWIGYPIGRLIDRFDHHLKRNKGSAAHTIKINEAEEDACVLIHNWTCEILWAIYPYPDELMPYFIFDRDLPAEKQQKAMTFYKNMIQRHLYAHGGNKILLSKNPPHTGKLAALTKAFPDARFINLVRTPFEAMPSMMDYMSTGWKLFCDPVEAYPFQEEFFKVMKYYYLYPAEYFKEQPDRCNFIKYEDLVQNPDEIIEDLYDWLGLAYREEFKEVVTQETQKAYHFQSQHDYSIEEIGLTKEKIYSEFEEVFSFYEFGHEEFDLPDHVMFWQIKDWPKGWKLQRQQRQRVRIARRETKKANLEKLSGGRLGQEEKAG